MSHHFDEELRLSSGNQEAGSAQLADRTSGRQLDTQLNSVLYIGLKRTDPVVRKGPVGLVAALFNSADCYI
jgi:hypothetical protein